MSSSFEAMGIETGPVTSELVVVSISVKKGVITEHLFVLQNATFIVACINKKLSKKLKQYEVRIKHCAKWVRTYSIRLSYSRVCVQRWDTALQCVIANEINHVPQAGSVDEEVLVWIHLHNELKL